jgi:dihydroorotate dehydrogenase (NAD+) catalytic subunit
MNNTDMRVCIAGVLLKNPVTTASGTFSAKDSSKFYDISRLGAVITKGVSSVAWQGNSTPRVAETYGGMLNAVGLQNPGVDSFIKDELAFLRDFDVPVIANVVGKNIDEYCEVTEKLNDSDVAMLEINISCPNVKEGGISFGTNPKTAAELTKQVKKIAKKPLILKLSPNVSDITEIAAAVESEGADCISLINTLTGMKIDVYTRKPVLANITGGLSGPAIKPIAVRMVYQVRKVVKIPIIGLGGIQTGEDVAEFLMAGADAVSVGTAALVDPTAPIRIIDELKGFMEKQGYQNICELKGD